MKHTELTYTVRWSKHHNCTRPYTFIGKILTVPDDRLWEPCPLADEHLPPQHRAQWDVQIVAVKSTLYTVVAVRTPEQRQQLPRISDVDFTWYVDSVTELLQRPLHVTERMTACNAMRTHVAPELFATALLDLHTHQHNVRIARNDYHLPRQQYP